MPIMCLKYVTHLVPRVMLQGQDYLHCIDEGGEVIHRISNSPKGRVWTQNSLENPCLFYFYHSFDPTAVRIAFLLPVNYK